MIAHDEAPFRRGMLMAQDPENAQDVRAGRAVTTLRSPWLHLYCATCDHTFRPGDAVRFDSTGEPLHDMAELPCAGVTAGSPTDSSAAAAFFSGLETAWPLRERVQVIRLAAGHRLLMPAMGAYKRHRCFVCGHTLRVNDCVVVCPCGLDSLRCEAAIHNDVYQSRLCFSDWNPSQTRRHCPATTREVDA